jgi:hypothetical protein
VLGNIYTYYLDEKYFPESMTFKPESFLDRKIPVNEIMPFSIEYIFYKKKPI